MHLQEQNSGVVRKKNVTWRGVENSKNRQFPKELNYKGRELTQ